MSKGASFSRAMLGDALIRIASEEGARERCFPESEMRFQAGDVAHKDRIQLAAAAIACIESWCHANGIEIADVRKLSEGIDL